MSSMSAKLAERGENSNVSQHEQDEWFMRRCIQLALNAEGDTYPNPMVGAVVVHNGRIIGEGWHHRAGLPHAEVNAIASVHPMDLHLLPQSTIYVSLEPCAHFGRTPPCADLIVRTGLKRVVVGCSDSFDKVNGKGIERIREAGIDVTLGVLEPECRWLNRRFFTVQEKKRPYVILKWAQTYDHFIGKRDLNGLPQPMAISNTLCMTSVHHQRGIEGGILVGGGTVRSDNSRLTCRLWPSQHQPTRMILSPSLNIPEDVAMFCQEGQTLVFNGKREADYGSVKFIKVDFEAGREAEQVMQIALNRGIQSVIVEGGAHTLSRFIKQGMWDEAYVYEGQQIVNTGVRAPVLSALPDREVAMGWDCILRHYTHQGSVPKSFAL